MYLFFEIKYLIQFIKKQSDFCGDFLCISLQYCFKQIILLDNF